MSLFAGVELENSLAPACLGLMWNKKGPEVKRSDPGLSLTTGALRKRSHFVGDFQIWSVSSGTLSLFSFMKESPLRVRNCSRHNLLLSRIAEAAR